MPGATPVRSGNSWPAWTATAATGRRPEPGRSPPRGGDPRPVQRVTHVPLGARRSGTAGIRCVQGQLSRRHLRHSWMLSSSSTRSSCSVALTRPASAGGVLRTLHFGGNSEGLVTFLIYSLPTTLCSWSGSSGSASESAGASVADQDHARAGLGRRGPGRGDVGQREGPGTAPGPSRAGDELNITRDKCPDLGRGGRGPHCRRSSSFRLRSSEEGGDGDLRRDCASGTAPPPRRGQ